MSMERQVSQVLSEYDGEYDIPAIAAEISNRGVTDIDHIDNDVFWSIADCHEVSKTPTPLDQFRIDLTAAIAAMSDKEPATWEGEYVRVEVYWADRECAGQWPKPGTKVIIASSYGSATTSGEFWTSWESLWDRITREEDGLAAFAASQMDTLRAHHRDMTAAQAALHKVRTIRDNTIRRAARAGISVYRMAHEIGIAESTVERVLNRDG